MNKVIKYLAIGASIALIVRRFIEPTKVVGDSMFPELHDGDRLILDKASYEKGDPEPGDVVVFTEPGEKERYLIKRVIGIPGDHVVIHDGKLMVNGITGNDDYTAEGATNGEVDMVIPEGRYFLMGDNRLHSKDSRDAMIGCVPRDAIIGKVEVRIYPPGKVYSRDVVSVEESQAETE